MPKLKKETIDRRKKLYNDNKEMLDTLYKFFRGNIIQKQAREFIINLKITNTNKTAYTTRSFNKVITQLEKENMIGRKQYYDTNNKCIVFRKYLISLITGIDNIDNIPNTTMKNKYFEIYDVNLFKAFYILKQSEKGTELNDLFIKNTMFLDNTQIISIYDDFINIAEKIKPNTDHNIQDINKKIFVNKINQINRARNKQKEKDYKDNNDKINLANENTSYKFKVCDLYTLKNRKIYLTDYNYNYEDITFKYAIFCSSTNYDIKKLCNNIGDTIVSSLEFVNSIYSNDKIKFNFHIYTYNEKILESMKSNFFDERNINYKNGNPNKRYNFTYCNRLLQDLKLAKFKYNFNFYFYNTNINNNYREEATRFDLKIYNKSTGKKEMYQTLEERLNKKDEEIKSINDKSNKQIEEKNSQIKKIKQERDLKIEKLNKEKEAIISENEKLENKIEKTKQGTTQTFMDLHKQYNSIIQKKDNTIKNYENEIKRLREELARRK